MSYWVSVFAMYEVVIVLATEESGFCHASLAKLAISKDAVLGLLTFSRIQDVLMQRSLKPQTTFLL